MSASAWRPSNSIRSFRVTLAAGTVLCSGMAVPAMSQSFDGQPVPAVQSSQDSYGVDLATGALNLSVTDISAGSGTTGLVHRRNWLGSGWWRDDFDIFLSESTGKVTISSGSSSKTFTASNGTYVDDQGAGSSLIKQNGSYILTASDGTITTFNITTYPSGIRANTIKRATGETLTFLYGFGQYFSVWQGRSTLVQRMRLNDVVSSDGYRLHYRYGSEVPGEEGRWLDRRGVSLENTVRGGVVGSTVYDSSNSYSNINGVLTQTATDSGGRSTRYGTSSGRLISITPLADPNAAVSIAYNPAGRVSQISDATGATSYTYADSGGFRPTRVTSPDGVTNSYIFSIATLLMQSSTSASGLGTSYQYDGYGRLLSKISNGITTRYGYDGRGNVIETRLTARTGSGLQDIVTSAGYTCTSAATCDKPQWVRNARGGQSDFTYDPATGNPVTITAPADTAGLRAVTTFGYTTVNGAQKPASATICVTAPSCPGGAGERVTSIGYDANGLPNTVTVKAGDNSVAAATVTAYDIAGNIVSINGPLAGADDTTYLRYDSSRQIAGIISPDPDGPGAMVRRARRITRDGLGRVTLSEEGTVTEPGDAGWNGFVSLRQVSRTWEGAGRPVIERVTAAGGTYSVTQQSYSGRRLDCVAVRMNPGAWGSLPASACTAQAAGTAGPDRIIQFGYDAADRVISRASGVGSGKTIVEAATYTSIGTPLTSSDGNGNATAFGYDGFDRPQTTTYPGGSFEQLTYDAYGSVTRRRLRSGQGINYGYDALDRLMNTSPDGERGVAYRYDMLGQRRRHTNGPAIPMQ